MQEYILISLSLAATALAVISKAADDKTIEHSLYKRVGLAGILALSIAITSAAVQFKIAREEHAEKMIAAQYVNQALLDFAVEIGRSGVDLELLGLIIDRYKMRNNSFPYKDRASYLSRKIINLKDYGNLKLPTWRPSIDANTYVKLEALLTLADQIATNPYFENDLSGTMKDHGSALQEAAQQFAGTLCSTSEGNGNRLRSPRTFQECALDGKEWKSAIDVQNDQDEITKKL